MGHKTFVVHVAALNVDLSNEMHPLKRAQIAHLKAVEAPIKVSSKYADFTDVFSPKLVVKPPKHMGINNHVIKLVDNLQPLYSLIYRLGPIELETMKIYIKNNLTSGFIRPSKSCIGALIFFDKKLDRGLRLCINYRGFNNLIIKNRYLLSLISKSLN